MSWVDGRAHLRDGGHGQVQRARLDVVSVTAAGAVDHGRGAVHRGHMTAAQPVAHQTGRDPVAAAEFQHVVVGLECQTRHRPLQAFRDTGHRWGTGR